MIKAGVGISADSRPAHAAREAADIAMGNGGIVQADAVVVFVTSDYADGYGAALTEVGKVTGAKSVAGCSASGVLVTGAELEHGPAVGVMALQSPDMVISPFNQTLDAADQYDSAANLVSRFPKGRQSNRAIVMFADPAGFQPEFVQTVASMSATAWVAGGGASGGERSSPVFYSDKIMHRSVSGLHFSGSAVPTLGTAAGVKPLGQPFFITRSKRNVILELDGRPAVEALQAVLRRFALKELETGRAVVLAGISDRIRGRTVSSDDFVTRPIMGVDEKTGAVAISQQVREGQTVTFLLRDAETSRANLARMLDTQISDLSALAPRFGFYFNCAGRGSGLYGAADQDISMIGQALGDIPILGFFSSFEVASTRGVRGPAAPRIHGFTGALMIFSEKFRG